MQRHARLLRTAGPSAYAKYAMRHETMPPHVVLRTYKSNLSTTGWTVSLLGSPSSSSSARYSIPPPCDSYNSLSHAGLYGQFPSVLPVGTLVCSGTHVSLNQLPSPARSKYSLQPPVLVLCTLLFRKHAINLDLGSRAVSASSGARTVRSIPLATGLCVAHKTSACPAHLSCTS